MVEKTKIAEKERDSKEYKDMSKVIAKIIKPLTKKAAKTGKKQKTPWLIRDILIVLALIILVYVLFFMRKTCTTQDCFLEGVWKCSRVDYTSQEASMTWSYSIQGLTKDSCRIIVKAVDVKETSKETRALKKSMVR